MSPPGARVHRDQIDAAVRQYGTMPRGELPAWLRSPRGERQFALAMAVELLRHDPALRGAAPVYDRDGFLIAWQGIRLRAGP